MKSMKKGCRCDSDIILRDCPFHRAHYLKKDKSKQGEDAKTQPGQDEDYQTPKASKLRKRNKKNAGTKSTERTEAKNMEVKDH